MNQWIPANTTYKAIQIGKDDGRDGGPRIYGWQIPGYNYIEAGTNTFEDSNGILNYAIVMGNFVNWNNQHGSITYSDVIGNQACLDCNGEILESVLMGEFAGNNWNGGVTGCIYIGSRVMNDYPMDAHYMNLAIDSTYTTHPLIHGTFANAGASFIGSLELNAPTTVRGDLSIADIPHNWDGGGYGVGGKLVFDASLANPSAGVVTLCGGSAYVTTGAYNKPDIYVFKTLVKAAGMIGEVEAAGNTTTGVIRFNSHGGFFDGSVYAWQLVEIKP